MTRNIAKSGLALAITLFSSQCVLAADSIKEAVQKSKVSGDFRMRYEDVEVSNTTSDGLTLRSRLSFKTDSYQGFSASAEIEDVRDVFGIDDENGLIPDPEVTETDQAFLQYKSANFTTKLGRQVITLDGHRFIGHVGWRQDRQTYDAARVTYSPVKGLTLDASYLFQRNRILAETADANASDILLNVKYKTDIGALVGYGYLLDDETTGAESDTYGISFKGEKGAFLYTLEYATQDLVSAGGAKPDYIFTELGAKLSGITAKVGFESLGSDDGVSFSTPLATLHKFNGWADVFLVPTFLPTGLPLGLEDTYLSVSGTLGGIKLAAIYHDFESEASGDSYGDEINLSVTKGFKNGLSLGLKYADYSSDENNLGAGNADVSRLWVWTSYKF